jgi:xanthine dehydrogenase accessory factor
MTKVWARIRETIDRHGSAALVSVINSAGSAPREVGARIVLQPDGGFFGTIGGGRLEYEAIAEARATLSAGRGRAQFRNWPLGPNLGQCCGGTVKTLTETFDADDLGEVQSLEAAEQSGVFVTVSRVAENGRIVRTVTDTTREAQGVVANALDKTSFAERFGESTTSVLLFGAGHVGRAVVIALAPLPFAVRWIDSRPEQFPLYIPQNVVTVCTDAAERELAGARGDAMVVIMTHSHPRDFEITAAALRQGTFAYVGLIGSDTKRARFANFARRLGIPEEQIERLVCPIGMPQVKGKEPAIIAAALAAQLLAAREQVIIAEDKPAT